nr:OmpA family protein [Actinomyces bowdenii]
MLGRSEETENNPDPVRLESYTAAVDGASDTRVTEKSVTVTLASDVLFAVDSAELSGEADTALQGAADQLKAYSGGEVSIVGHTDDVADDAYNQDLSTRRAQAVADRLGQLTDMSAFTVSVSGKGEGEPRVPNDSDENRRLNRRVEVVLVPTQEVSERKGSSSDGGELPAAEGPEAKGSEGVIVSWGRGDGEAVFTLEEVTRYGNYLVGEVKFTGGVGGSGASPSEWLQPTGIIQNARGESDGGLASAVTGLSLLTPRERYYAVDYRTKGGTNRPLSELDAKDELGEGDTTTLTIVWPDTGQDTVTLDLEAPAKNAPQSNNPFRLTDIPVVEP